ncbi:hypothetical protein [Acinetobacter larvae]|uniref:Uncharacterized protein n=1 Tax=Acinetobacter larvae TaxID=1789224 RepID=A0A1B2LZH7_9GAMM|nr:hypothetical protein [Acinetobacter larvae]AOA58183.1 hypothetical protein BFG52_07340 [Acinetobacter larvae]
MQYQPFVLDQESAKQADAGGRIENGGEYVGTIKSMEFITANTGTQGFEIEFETDSREHANITIWTTKSDGTPLSGSHKVNALLACIGVRGLTPTDKKMEKYDFESKQRVVQVCVVAPEAEGKRVGLLLQRENYTNKSGQPRHQMNFYASFQEKTKLMAKEILDRKTTAELFPKALDRLMLNPTVDRKGNSTQQNQNSGNGYSNSSPGYGGQPDYGFGNTQGYENQPPINNRQSPDLDDDLPF